MRNNDDLIALFENTLKNNWDSKALADYGGNDFTYSEVANNIGILHDQFRTAGVVQGDKIAIIGKNSAHWGIIYIAVVTYGAVIVPLLPDFPAESVENLVTHSDSVLLFSSKAISSTLDLKNMPLLQAIIGIEDFLLIETAKPELQGELTKTYQAFIEANPSGISRDAVSYVEVDKECSAVISYTSGTTGVSKGVVIPHRSLFGNMIFAQNNMPLQPGDKIVSFLPSAHMYGCAFEFLFPFTIGCFITFLTKTPTPAVVLKAFGEIKPALILSVPLVIEKIYKKKIKPELDKPLMKFMAAVPGLRHIVYNKIRQSVYDSFGGKFKELVVGGAAFNPEAEAFFRTIKLPFTVGYGMTECGPLMAYASWNTTELGASGRAVDALEVTIDSADPQNVIGEILCRGSHVMSGYYKNEEETAKVIDADGWFHSGDLGTIDAKGNIFIKGRKKTMLLSSTGKNIYPDEIESIINSMWAVLESIVVMREGRLLALVVPDKDALKLKGKTVADMPDLLAEFRVQLNKKLAKYMHVTEFNVQEYEFAKTPKRSIKRFMYQ